jgi:hypothetical protein
MLRFSAKICQESRYQQLFKLPIISRLYCAIPNITDVSVSTLIGMKPPCLCSTHPSEGKSPNSGFSSLCRWASCKVRSFSYESLRL